MFDEQYTTMKTTMVLRRTGAPTGDVFAYGRIASNGEQHRGGVLRWFPA
ncbi:hypothetical protein HY480_01160 [Candidatus Uhrbacteria bacterium]|nr:hypothetical protein [Candidatus Uhrbacteria bacterium]